MARPSRVDICSSIHLLLVCTLPLAACDTSNKNKILLPAGSDVKFDAESTYHSNFPAFQVEPRPRPPPAVAAKNPARFDGTTTNGETYKAHQIEPHQVCTFSKASLFSFSLVLMFYDPGSGIPGSIRLGVSLCFWVLGWGLVRPKASAGLTAKHTYWICQKFLVLP